jgi:hypothetical protein
MLEQIPKPANKLHWLLAIRGLMGGAGDASRQSHGRHHGRAAED